MEKRSTAIRRHRQLRKKTLWKSSSLIVVILCLLFSTVIPRANAGTTEPTNTNMTRKEMGELISKLLETEPKADTPPPSPWNKITQVSVKSSGEQGFGGHSFDPSLSQDGRFVVFESNRALIDGKNVHYNEIYIHDRLKGTTELVSYGMNGAYGNGDSRQPMISANGEFVAFSSRASNLVSGDTNGWDDIFVRDLTNGLTERITLATNGDEPDDGSYLPTISGDGRYIAYESYATNLIEGEPVANDSGAHVYLYDRATKQTIRLSTPNGTPIIASSPQLSANGEYLAFSSRSEQLVTGDENNDEDIFLYHIKTSQYERVSLTAAGEESQGWSRYPAISADGYYVSFASDALDLVPGTEDYGYKERIYLRNRLTNTTELITNGLNGAEPDGYSYNSAVSDDGRYVSFESDANNLVEGDFFDPERFQEYQNDVFVYDTVTKRTERVVFPLTGEYPDEFSGAPAISGDGRAIAYLSDASNLVNDPNASQGIYVTSDGSQQPVWPSGSTLSITEVSNQSVTLQWPRLDAVLGYRIYQDGKRIAFTESNTFKVDKLDMSTMHIFKVEAVGPSFSLSSNGPVISTDDKEAPEWPSDAKIKVEAIAPSSVTLSWTPATDNVGVANYRVFYLQGTSYQFLAASPEPSITLSNLTPNTEYKFKVYAGDIAQNFTDDGPTITVKTLTGDSEYVESALFVEPHSGGRANLRWVKDELATIATYEVWRVEAEQAGQLVKTINDAAATTYQDSGLASETSYTYQIIGRDASGKETYRTKKVAITTLALQITSLQWSLDRIKGYAKQQGTLAISITGDANQTAEASFIYQTTDGNQKKQNIPLGEKATGIYEGSFKLPTGVTELTSLNVTLADSKGHVVIQSPADWTKPIQVLGSLEVAVRYKGDAGDYFNGAKILAWSPSKRSTATVYLTDQVTYQLNELIPADDYFIRLIAVDGSLIREATNHSVLSGQSVTAAVEVDIPASLHVSVKNPVGEAIANARVRLLDENGEFLRELYTSETGQVSASGFMTNERLQAEIRLDDQPYFSKTGMINLDSSHHQVEVMLTPFKPGKLQGKVVNQHGDPLKRLQVTAVQTIDGRSFHFYGETDSNGNYSLDVYEGALRVSFSGTGVAPALNQVVTIPENETITLDKSLVSTGKGKLDLKIYTKKIGEGWEGPLNLSEIIGTEYQISISSLAYPRWGHAPLIPPYGLEGLPGDEVEVCVSHQSLGYQCKTAELDDSWNATIEIQLEEKGARVEGFVVSEQNGDPIGGWQGWMYRFDPAEQKWEDYGIIRPKRVTMLSANVYEAGRYKIEIEHTDQAQVKRFTEVELELLNGEVKDLSGIILNEVGVFSGQRGNSFAAIPNEMAPGREITLRGTYQHKQAETLRDVTFLLEIPKGTSFKEGSMVVDGKVPDKVTFDADKNRYEVKLDEVKPGVQGVVRYQVVLNPDLEQSEISAKFRVAFKDAGLVEKVETIGAAFIRTPQMTIDGLDKIDSLSQILLSGRAPGGSDVSVYTGNTLLGVAKSLETGIWSLKVNLPNLGSPRNYKLRAETTVNGKTYRSGERSVLYDKNQPKILSITMWQDYTGKKAVVDLSKGGRFPFTVNPGYPVHYEAVFTKPHLVKNVYVHVGEGSALLTLEDGVYKTTMPFQGSGDIYVTYDTIYEAESMDYDSIKTEEDFQKVLEDYQQALPDELKDFAVENVDISKAANGIDASLTMKGLPFADAIDLDMSIEEDVEYTPTEEDLAFAQEYGVHLYDFEQVVEEVNGDYQVTISGVLPKAVQGTGQQALRSSRNAVGILETPVQTLIRVSIDMTIKGSDVQSTVGSYGGMAYNMTRIEILAEQMAQCPDPSISRALERTLEDIKNTEIIKWSAQIGLTAIGTAATAASLGFGLAVGIGLFAYGNMLSDSLDGRMNKKMEAIEQRVAEHLSKCAEDDKANPSKKRFGNGNGWGSGLGSPVASPYWIFDPSGFVYEAVTSNRLDGVTATVTFKNPNTNLWEIWDATWFEQINPQVTGRDGRYGWDVPEGLWQVHYEKPGYERAKSAELVVLPPHFDVNIGMVSYVAPEVEKVRAVDLSAGEDFVEVMFTKHIDVDSLLNSTVTVASVDGEILSGEVTAVQKDQEEMEKRLTRIIRFHPTSGKIIAGETYSVSVAAREVVSYAGVQMSERFGAEVVAVMADETAPELVSASVDRTGTVITLEFNEPVMGGEVDIESFRLSGTSAVPLVAGLAGYEEASRRILVHLGNAILPNERVSITLVAGAVKDRAGNAVEGLSRDVVNLVASANAELSQLSFHVGRLTPAFNRLTKEYTLTVGKNVKFVEVRAVVADVAAAVSLEGLRMGNGVARKVLLTGDETELAFFVTAGNGVTIERYTVRVVRSDVLPPVEPDQPDVPEITPPPGPILPGAVIDGEVADISAWFVVGADGKVTFNKDALGQLEKLAKVKRATIDVTKVRGEVRLDIPVSSIVKLAEKGIELVVKTAGANAVILPDVEKMKLLLEMNSDVSLRVIVSGANMAVSAPALNPITKPMVVSFELLAGEAKVAVGDAAGLQVELLLNEAEVAMVKDAMKLGVYRFDEAAGGWIYVRGFVDWGNRMLRLNVTSQPGIYVVGEFNLSFADLGNHWVRQEVEWLAAKHVVTGSQGNYTPNANITRVQFAAMLLRALGLKEYDGGSEPTFRDVTTKHWAFGVIEAVTRAGYLKVGDGAGFGPSGLVTREEMVVHLMLALEKEGRVKVELSPEEIENILAGFVDHNELDPASRATFAKAIKLGIILGINTKELRPKLPATRAQAAVMVRRYLSVVGVF
jgi:large repetitive protein